MYYIQVELLKDRWKWLHVKNEKHCVKSGVVWYLYFVPILKKENPSTLVAEQVGGGGAKGSKTPLPSIFVKVFFRFEQKPIDFKAPLL